MSQQVAADEAQCCQFEGRYRVGTKVTGLPIPLKHCRVKLLRYGWTYHYKIVVKRYLK